MIRLALTTLALVSLSTLAHAHFVFIVEGGGKVIFSDTLEPDLKVSTDKLTSGLKLWAKSASGALSDAKLMPVKGGLQVSYPENVVMVGGVCDYGVSKKGDSAYLIRYYPKAVTGPIESANKLLMGDKLALEIVPVLEGDKLKFQAYAQGKPLPRAAMWVLVPGQAKEDAKWAEVETDDSGFSKQSYTTQGTYGVRVLQKVEQPGKLGEVGYDEVRNYATLVVKHGTR